MALEPATQSDVSPLNNENRITMVSNITSQNVNANEATIGNVVGQEDIGDFIGAQNNANGENAGDILNEAANGKINFEKIVY